MKFISSVLFSLVFSSAAVASDVHNAKIERLMVDTSMGIRFLLKLIRYPEIHLTAHRMEPGNMHLCLIQS